MNSLIQKKILSEVSESCEVRNKILRNESLISAISDIAELCIKVYRQGNKTILAGNGGSAADAQHIAAELSGRLNFNRPPIPSLALTTNSSEVTAIANDFGYENVFSRLVEANGLPGDVFIGLSTSGKSLNILNAVKKCKQLGIVTVCLTGARENPLQKDCDYCISIPSGSTQRIQECHLLIGHIICGLVEENLFVQEGHQ